jgi:hypothetical protein
MARKDKPRGKEIAEKAKSAKFLSEHSTTVKKDGKQITATPVNLRHVTEQELEQGQIIGLLETELDEQTTGLPPGAYHMFMAKISDQWHVLAESGGTLVAEGRDVQVEKLPRGQKAPKPKLEFGSLWIRFCICIDSDCWCAVYRFIL